jgi:hypothetical protein
MFIPNIHLRKGAAFILTPDVKFSSPGTAYNIQL